MELDSWPVLAKPLFAHAVMTFVRYVHNRYMLGTIFYAINLIFCNCVNVDLC